MLAYNSKKGIVSKAPYELYMAFVDMRNFVQYLPEDKRSMIEADYDTIKVNVQGYSIGAKVLTRQPYSKLELVDCGAPFAFKVTVNFDGTGAADKTEFSVDVEADLNFMMKMIIGNKIKDALDKVVDGLVAVSEGRMPEGLDPSFADNFPGGFTGKA